jgi:peptidoglycan/LPS O-acetylase OafA/YrhL
MSTTAVRAPWFGAVRLGDRVGDRDNNFDILRLLAAWAVLVSHSFAVVGEREPLHQFNTTLGSLGVLIFFAVSGLLIRRSWECDPSPRDFWIKRGLRLLPALAVVSVATAFVLGPLVTSRSLYDYFSSWQTWVYPARITLLFPFGASLPGVFEGLKFAGAVNGPLWSLPVEVSAYFGLAVLGGTGLLRRRWLLLTISTAALVWAGIWASVMPADIGALYVLAAFSLGATAYSFKESVVLAWPVAVFIIGLCWIAGMGPTPLRIVVWTIGTVYLCYWFAYALPPIGRTITRFGDASYGIYIWAWPIQQILVEVFGGDVSPWVIMLVSTPLVWLVAQLSWHLVEAPALRKKPKAGGRNVQHS